MSFLPSSPDLGTIEVNQPFRYEFSYYDEVASATFPVSIQVSPRVQALDSITNELISIAFTLPRTVEITQSDTATIVEGYFTPAVFNRSYIEYITLNDVTRVQKIDGALYDDFWKELDRRADVDHTFHFRPDSRQSIVLVFIATAMNEQRDYNLIVNHPSYSVDRDLLIERISRENRG